MQATYAVDVAKCVEHEVLIILHVVGIDFYLKVVVASGVVAFRYLVYLLHRVHKLLDEVVGVLLQSDVAQHYHVVAQLVVVYHSRVSLYVSLSLQSFLPFEGGRGR